MDLVQKTLGGTTYYTDGMAFYTFHVVRSKDDALWKFACLDLGISGKPVGSDQQAKVNALAGTGVNDQTKYLLLQGGKAVSIRYQNTGNAILNINDVILRKVNAPSIGTVKCSNCTTIVLAGPTCAACGKPL